MAITKLDHHGTIVLGWSSEGKLIFSKTFDFSDSSIAEREQALEAFDFVRENCHNYVIGETESILHKSKFIEEETEER